MIIGHVDRACELNEVLPKIAPTFTATQLFFGIPKLAIDGTQTVGKVVQTLRRLQRLIEYAAGTIQGKLQLGPTSRLQVFSASVLR